MKKVLLLLTLISASQLYSMEPEKPNYMASLPKEIQVLILTGNNLDDTIRLIKDFRGINSTFKQMVNAHYGDIDNLQNFTKLVHVLANKFNKTTKIVAEKFGTKIAQQYITLGNNLADNIYWNRKTKKITQDINQGADINYIDDNYYTPLILAIKSFRPDVIKLLLDAKANLLYQHPTEGTALDIVIQQIKDFSLSDESKMIKNLLEEEMQKQSQNKKF